MTTSPFPGMDPYLEERWPEVHARLIVYAANQINPRLPDDLQANIEETLSVCADDVTEYSIRPDIHIAEDMAFESSTAAATDLAIAEPLLLPQPQHRTRNVEITDTANRIITAIEFISPWNKIGMRNCEQFIRRQLNYLDAGVSLVEIDLVRQGDDVLAAPLENVPKLVRTPYLICVTRATNPGQLEVYRAPLQKPLPNIPIPLRPHERDVVLQLQPLIDACYHDGRYHRTDYQKNPKARFDEADMAWLDARLREQNRRS